MSIAVLSLLAALCCLVEEGEEPGSPPQIIKRQVRDVLVAGRMRRISVTFEVKTPPRAV
jgi:hypothetical protein